RGLRPVLVENGVGQVLVVAQQGVRQRVPRGRVQRLDVAVGAEGAPHGGQPVPGGGLVAGDGDVVGVDEPQVDAVVAGGGDDLGGPTGNAHGQRVEVGAVHDLGPAGPQPLGEDRGVPVGAPGDQPQPLGAVVNGVHAGHDGEQYLGGADVAGGLLAADVLL